LSNIETDTFLVEGVPEWPVYKNGGGYGHNFYFNPNGSSVEPDTFRLAGTTFMNSVSREQFGR
jgi:hypothetical protein